MLEGVVQRGTGIRAKQLKKHLAGKTGTSNDSKDAWFIGFSPDIVCGVFVGFDAPKSLGNKEQGSSVALPIFINFMKQALADLDNKDFEVPKGINFIEVDISTGQKAGVFAGKNMVLEPVKPRELEKILNAEMSELPENNVEIKEIEMQAEGVY
jgi:penicillin-binding protein 1A